MNNCAPSSPRADLKIVIVGGGGVGKSSFIYRYVNNDFTDTLSTIAGAYVFKRWRNFHFSIWDMAGQEKFSKVSNFYCKGAGAIVLAYDITDSNSFNQLNSHAEMIKSSQKDAIVVVIGTKSDLVAENPEMRQVSETDAHNFSAGLNAEFFETSARLNINIVEVFDYIGLKAFPSAILSSAGPLDDSPVLEANNGVPKNNFRKSTFACCSIQ